MSDISGNSAGLEFFRTVEMRKILVILAATVSLAGTHSALAEQPAVEVECIAVGNHAR